MVDIKIRFHYHGCFFTKDQKLLYRKGSIYMTDTVDSDELSRFELDNFLKVGARVVGVKELWYVEGGKYINDGLHQINSDSDINDMVGSICDDKMAHVYVILDGDVSPTSILTGSNTEEGVRRSPRKHLALVLEGGERSTPNPFAYQSDGEDGVGRVDVGDDDSHQSDSVGEDLKFDDSGDEDEDLFDDLGDGGQSYGKELVEVVNRDFAFDNVAINVENPNSDVAEESDGLRSPVSTNDESEKRKRYPEFNHHLGFKAPIKLEPGMIFASNAIFRKAISQYSVEKGGDFYFLHNDNKKVSVQCKNKCDCEWKHCRRVCGSKTCATLRCLFRASARRMCSDGTFQLKSLNGEHTCGRQHLNARVTSNFLAEKYIEHYRDDPRMKLRAFINTVLRDMNVKITYSQAMRTRMRAFLMLQGDAKEQYAKVCDYAETLLKWKVASSSFVLCHGPVEKPIFQRFYVCLEACKKGFLRGCRPIIGLDGCHLKGAYTGQILSAVAKDGNENIFPLAYAVVESECKDSWGWFMENLLADLGSMNLCIMSDRQKGLLEALKDKAPMAEQRFCVRHLYGNFKKKFGGGTVLKQALWSAARATRKSDFDDAMKELREEYPKAADWLIEKGVHLWSKHAFRHFTKSDMLLNNICESWNKFILEARDEPILTCCEWIRRSLMHRFVKKRDGMMKYPGHLTPKAAKRLERAKNIGQERCTMWCAESNRFEVVRDEKTFIVDMTRQSCSCNKWGLTGIPCPHACAIILSRRGNKLEEYVDKYYSKEVYLRAYGSFIEAMPGRREWEQSRRSSPAPPIFKTQPGRPKKTRRRKEGEQQTCKQVRILTAQKYKCSNCGVAGHSKRGCKNPPRSPRKQAAVSRGGRPRNANTLNVSGNSGRRKKKDAFVTNTQDAGSSQLP